jgi:hypothetical protein
MKIRTIVLTVALCLVGVPVGFAQDDFMGVWKLKEAKLEFFPGAPKNSTVVYEAEGDKVKVTVDSISSDGNPTGSPPPPNYTAIASAKPKPSPRRWRTWRQAPIEVSRRGVEKCF